MKAVIRHQYGSPDILQIQEVEKPVPKDDEILIKIYATTVNRTDCGILKGTPFIIRFFTGFFKPKLSITGSDYAGQIEAVGKNITAFKAGDRVMGFGGMGIGSHAEYLAIPGKYAIVTIPDAFSYKEAAASMEGAFYAQYAINILKPQPGQKAMVNGGTGAIGSATIQFLKYYGVYVTATCRGEHRELVKSLGADRIIDYTTDDFTKDKEQYDYVFDAVGKSTFAKCKRLLKKNGIYNPTDGLENFVFALFTQLFGGKKVFFPPPRNLRAGLSFIRKLIEEGKFKPVLDKTYSLDQIRDAFNYALSGKKVGNIIIDVQNKISTP